MQISHAPYSHLVFFERKFDKNDLNFEKQGKGTCVRSSPIEKRIDYPVINVNSDDMACSMSSLMSIGFSRVC